MLSTDITNELCRRTTLAEGSVDREIHPTDNMLSGGQRNAYFSIGRRALALICQTFDRESRLPESILDFPSGWGRCTRWFRAAFPEIEIGAGDVWHNAVVHVAKTFNATPIKSQENLVDVQCGNYDCIFVGSLVTHFSEQKALEFLDWCIDHLTDDGVAIITSHGRTAKKKFISKPNRSAFPTPESLTRTIGVFDSGGYGFQPNTGETKKHMQRLSVSEYGLSLVSPSWWMRQILLREDVEIADYVEKGWNRHQDVIVLRKTAGLPPLDKQI